MADEPTYREPDRAERLRALRAEHAQLTLELAALERSAQNRRRQRVLGFLLSTGALLALITVVGGLATRTTDDRIDLHHVDCPGVGVVDTENHESHCGSCGHRCERDELECHFGTCVCPENRLDHGGACVDLATDPAHCGSMTTACPPGVACVAGHCQCAEGLSECYGHDGLTHCVDYDEDELHCGDCWLECGRGATCHGGTCACDDPALTHCFPNQSYFGACVDLQNDPYNCGACDHFCETGDAPTCVNGACVAGR